MSTLQSFWGSSSTNDDAQSQLQTVQEPPCKKRRQNSPKATTKCKSGGQYIGNKHDRFIEFKDKHLKYGNFFKFHNNKVHCKHCRATFWNGTQSR